MSFAGKIYILDNFGYLSYFMFPKIALNFFRVAPKKAKSDISTLKKFKGS